MNRPVPPMAIGPAEQTLIDQLRSLGADAEAEKLAMAGLPTRRIEAYHYTDLKRLIRAVPPLAMPAEAISAPAARLAGAYRILMVNGDIAIKGAAPNGIIASTVKGSALTARENTLVRLNTALVRQSLSLNLDHSVDPVVHLDRRIEGPAGHVADCASIFVGDGGTATILETISGSAAAHMGNHGTRLHLGKGASVTHILLDLSDKASTQFQTVEYDLGEGANLRSIVVHAGARLARTQIFGRFGGTGAHGDFSGLNLADDGQHLDVIVSIEHLVPGTTSVENFKQVARGHSRAIVQGRILVAPGAQQTDARMMVRGLMLSETAEIFAKPELEIFADDVQCAHGATCGELDDEALFYFMSRGIPRAEAEAMLVRAFVSDAFDTIEHDELKEMLDAIVEGWLDAAPEPVQ